MRSSSWIAFKSFLHKAPLEKQKKALAHLSDACRKRVETLPEIAGGPSSLEISLSDIHFSWFASYLRTLTERDIRLFLSVLSEPQAALLKKTLLFSGATVSVGEKGKRFLQKTLLQKISADQMDLLPLVYLPESPLNPLPHLKTADLNLLITNFGLRDLAVEMRQIIETAKLKLIYNALSLEQQEYLKTLLHSHEGVVFSRMGLSHWKGDAESLKILLHQRGLNRLGKALYGQHPSLIWHLVHHLDTDQAVFLQKLILPLENQAAAKLLISQIVELLSYKDRS